jgi:hypothetical protein
MACENEEKTFWVCNWFRRLLVQVPYDWDVFCCNAHSGLISPLNSCGEGFPLRAVYFFIFFIHRSVRESLGTVRDNNVTIS